MLLDTESTKHPLLDSSLYISLSLLSLSHLSTQKGLYADKLNIRIIGHENAQYYTVRML